MEEMIKVAVDAMGGDHAPAEIVKGAVDAVKLRQDIMVYLIGREEIVKEEDRNAFMIVSSASEIFGEGYKDIMHDKI